MMRPQRCAIIWGSSGVRQLPLTREVECSASFHCSSANPVEFPAPAPLLTEDVDRASAASAAFATSSPRLRHQVADDDRRAGRNRFARMSAATSSSRLARRATDGELHTFGGQRKRDPRPIPLTRR